VTDIHQDELEQLAQRYRALQHKIAQAPRLSEDQKTELLAVSKGQGVNKIRRLFELGQRRFGENYLQELLTKQQGLSDLAIDWVFIGHLQTNKIKKIVQHAVEIQSVASLKHAAAIAQAAREFERRPYPIYLAINADAEDTKNGVNFADLPALYQQIQQQFAEDIQIMGIMAVPSSEHRSSVNSEIPAVYHQLRSLADQIGEGMLSLGMSGDLEIAIRAGSNLVRIGTALMGERSQNPRLSL